MSWKGKKVLILHFRVGRTDGVSLQIACWKEILEREGAIVKLASGPNNTGADFIVDRLENQLDPEIFAFDEEAFGGFKKIKTEDEFFAKFEKISREIRTGLEKVFADFRPDQLIVSNIFSVGENLTAAAALFEVICKSQVPALLVNHDFYWENKRYEKPSTPFVKKYFDQYFPPRHYLFTYACINSIAQDELRKRRGIKAILIHDTLDFKQQIADHGARCARLLNKFGVHRDDLVVLQATRIVRRKNIELAIDLVRDLSTPERLKRIEERGLYSGKGFEADRNRIVLVLAGYAEKRDEKYLQALVAHATKSDVKAIWLNGAAAAYATEQADGPTLLDLHCYADLVTYPSSHEGFGNQFLEGVLSETPVVVYPYPVFKRDLLPAGFEVIDLGEELEEDPKTGLKKLPRRKAEEVADQALDILTNRHKYLSMVEKNFEIARQKFSYDKTLEIFKTILFRRRDAVFSKTKIPYDDILGRTIFKVNSL